MLQKEIYNNIFNKKANLTLESQDNNILDNIILMIKSKLKIEKINKLEDYPNFGYMIYLKNNIIQIFYNRDNKIKLKLLYRYIDKHNNMPVLYDTIYKSDNEFKKSLNDIYKIISNNDKEENEIEKLKNKIEKLKNEINEKSEILEKLKNEINEKENYFKDTVLYYTSFY